MQLLDITGKQLQQWNVVPSSINIGQFAKGTYGLKMGLKNGETIIQKINKQKKIPFRGYWMAV
jgi:hypothetical protein